MTSVEEWNPYRTVGNRHRFGLVRPGATSWFCFMLSPDRAKTRLVNRWHLVSASGTDIGPPFPSFTATKKAGVIGAESPLRSTTPQQHNHILKQGGICLFYAMLQNAKHCHGRFSCTPLGICTEILKCASPRAVVAVSSLCTWTSLILICMPRLG